MSQTEKLERLMLTPEELVSYQAFFQQQGAALAETGRITLEYQAALQQAKDVVSKITQVREQWAIKALSSRGINPATGKWSILPQTGEIINEAKLHVVDT